MLSTHNSFGFIFMQCTSEVSELHAAVLSYGDGTPLPNHMKHMTYNKVISNNRLQKGVLLSYTDKNKVSKSSSPKSNSGHALKKQYRHTSCCQTMEGYYVSVKCLACLQT